MASQGVEAGRNTCKPIKL